MAKEATIGGERAVTVSLAMWTQIIKGAMFPKRFRVLTPIPKDAEVVRCGYDRTGMLAVIFRSREWPELKDGEPIPDLDVKFETVQDGQA